MIRSYTMVFICIHLETIFQSARLVEIFYVCPFLGTYLHSKLCLKCWKTEKTHYPQCRSWLFPKIILFFEPWDFIIIHVARNQLVLQGFLILSFFGNDFSISNFDLISSCLHFSERKLYLIDIMMPVNMVFLIRYVQ